MVPVPRGAGVRWRTRGALAGLPKGIDDVLGLLSVIFTPDAEPPGGVITLIFAPKAEVRLKVECLDVTLMDEGPVWPTRRRPNHGVAS